MAVNNLDNYKNTDGFGMSLNIRRGNPNPLDNSSLWSSYDEAKDYAENDPAAYVGQILTVINNNEINHYYIVNEQGDLMRLLDKENLEWKSF